MKINKLLCAATTSLVLLSTTVAAKPPFHFQAGNIEDGQTWSINAAEHNMASYWAKYPAGTVVQFSCEVQGDPTPDCQNNVKAYVIPGKSFEMNDNSPYTPISRYLNPNTLKWVLSASDQDSEGNVTGNIKVFYQCGSNVTISCRGGKVG